MYGQPIKYWEFSKMLTLLEILVKAFMSQNALL